MQKNKKPLAQRQTRKVFALRPHDSEGAWQSNDARYRIYAHELLADLKTLCAEVKSQWPIHIDLSLDDDSQYANLSILIKNRDRTSDVTRIYAAMAVEGFLNFYGVLRLGQEVFESQFERLGLVPKIRLLLLVSENISVADNDPLIEALSAVASGRNALVHPKAKEPDRDSGKFETKCVEIPGTAQSAVSNMELFFTLFGQTVPAMQNFLSSRYRSIVAPSMRKIKRDANS